MKIRGIYVIKNQYFASLHFPTRKAFNHGPRKRFLRVSNLTLTSFHSSFSTISCAIKHRRVESKEKYLRLWWCFSIEHIWIHNITIYDFPLKLPMQCVPLSHNSLVLFFNLFPSIKFNVHGENVFLSRKQKQQQKAVSCWTESLFVPRRKT